MTKSVTLGLSRSALSVGNLESVSYSSFKRKTADRREAAILPMNFLLIRCKRARFVHPKHRVRFDHGSHGSARIESCARGCIRVHPCHPRSKAFWYEEGAKAPNRRCR